MTQRLGKIVVLMGGFHEERDISLKSGQAVLQSLQAQGFDAHGLDVQLDVVERLKAMKPDRAFIALHGVWGESGGMQGLLDMLNIPYTGSGLVASALAMDKCHTKRIWQAIGIPTPPFRILGTTVDVASVEALGFPLCMKPRQSGSSLGMKKITHRDELTAFWKAGELVEAWIEGDEYTVGILGDQPLPSLRIQTPHLFYDFNAKYTAKSTTYHCPSGLDAEQEATLHAWSMAAYQALGCRHWGRVDILRDRAGHFWCIELNTIPGLTPTSLLPKAAAVAGISFDALVVRLLAMTGGVVPKHHRP